MNLIKFTKNKLYDEKLTSVFFDNFYKLKFDNYNKLFNSCKNLISCKEANEYSSYFNKYFLLKANYLKNILKKIIIILLRNNLILIQF